MAFTLPDLARLLGHHADPAQHVVLVDGKRKGTCTEASFRLVLSLTGLEFVVDYAYELDGSRTALTSRLRSQGLGVGGREHILVNGQAVANGDVVVGSDL